MLMLMLMLMSRLSHELLLLVFLSIISCGEMGKAKCSVGFNKFALYKEWKRENGRR